MAGGENSLCLRTWLALIAHRARSKENVMAYIRLPLGIRVALEYELFGKVIVNVYHVTTTDPILTVKLIDIAEIFEAWWTNNLAAEFTTDIGLTAVTALNLDVPNGEKITVAVTPPVTGAEDPPTTTNNVAIVASFATAKTGRSFRGRAYLAGLRELSIAENVIGVLKAADIVDDYLDLLTLLELANSQFVIASFQTAGAPRAEGVATDVQSVSMNTRVDTQRRRLPK